MIVALFSQLSSIDSSGVLYSFLVAQSLCRPFYPRFTGSHRGKSLSIGTIIIMLSPIDLAIVLLTLLLPLAWYFRDSLPIISGKPRPATVSDGNGVHVKVDDGDPRDFVEKMENGVSGPISIDSGHRCKLS